MSMLDKKNLKQKFKFEVENVNRNGLGLSSWRVQAPSFGDFHSYKKKDNVGGIM